MAKTQPHDALFKAAFTDPVHAASHLRALLPPNVVARIDFATLEVVPGTFVDEALRFRHADVLYRVQVGGKDARIYVLHEHQSRVEPLMILRLLRYMLRIWDDHVGKHPKTKKIPGIFPVVVYHGEGRWHAATAFADLIDLEDDDRAAFAPYMPSFRFVLDDLTQASDASLRARKMSAFGRLVLWALKHARDPEGLLAGLASWAAVIRELLRAPNGQAAFELLLRYIFEVRPDLAPDQLPALVAASVPPEAKETAMNALERWIEEGRKEGRKEGREEGRREMLLKQLAAKFGPLPEADTARVEKASATEIEAWSLRLLSASTLAEVFAEPRAKPRTRR